MAQDKKVNKLKLKLKGIKKISEPQLIKGIRMTIIYAEDLLDSAKLLLKHKKFNLSAVIAIHSIEEIGRAYNLLAMLMSSWTPPSFQKDFYWYIFWANLKLHDKKILATIFPDFIWKKSLAGKEPNFKEAMEAYPKFKKISLDYNQRKQKYLYIDFDDKKNKFIIHRLKKRGALKLINYTQELLKKIKLYQFDKSHLSLAKEIIREQDKWLNKEASRYFSKNNH
ncbi:AbiV family abortive infection protein [Patescibacteria group bacterium]